MNWFSGILLLDHLVLTAERRHSVSFGGLLSSISSDVRQHCPDYIHGFLRNSGSCHLAGEEGRLRHRMRYLSWDASGSLRIRSMFRVKPTRAPQKWLACFWDHVGKWNRMRWIGGTMRWSNNSQTLCPEASRSNVQSLYWPISDHSKLIFVFDFIHCKQSLYFHSWNKWATH